MQSILHNIALHQHLGTETNISYIKLVQKTQN